MPQNISESMKFRVKKSEQFEPGHVYVHSMYKSYLPNNFCELNSPEYGKIIRPIMFHDQLATQELGVNQLSTLQFFGSTNDSSLVDISPVNRYSFQPIQSCKLYLSFLKFRKEKNNLSIQKLGFIKQIKEAKHGNLLSNNICFSFGQFLVRPEFGNKSEKEGLLSKETRIELSKEPQQKIDFHTDYTVEQAQQMMQNLPKKYQMDKLKVGGMTQQLQFIYRRIFALRQLHPSLLSKLGMKHTKGILLHGPPGTGKTLIARQISKMMDVQIKEVSGPSILSQYVGNAEEAVRELFADAIQQQQEKGNESKLHCIVIDQIDSLCSKRQSSNEKVYSLIVNQFLTCIDGFKELNNILVIGTTNRIDLIDDAILRPGRLEVHLEVHLPDWQGRLEIVNLYTQGLRTNGFLSSDFNPKTVASMTKNYTGAQLEKLIKDTKSEALNRWKQNDEKFQLSIGTKHLVQWQDFEKAFRLATKPQFGSDSGQLQEMLPEKRIVINNYQQQQQNIFDLIEKLGKGRHSILIQGKPGVGKTLMAVQLAKKAGYTYTKVITPQMFLQLSDEHKHKQMINIFKDAEKCHQSFIIIDDLMRIISYIAFRDQYNDVTLNKIIDLIKPVSKGNRKQIVVITAEDFLIKRLKLGAYFKNKFTVKQLEREEIRQFLISKNVGASASKVISSEIKVASVSKLIENAQISIGQKPEVWLQNWAMVNQQNEQIQENMDIDSSKQVNTGCRIW